MARSSAVVILTFERGEETRWTGLPSSSTAEASSVTITVDEARIPMQPSVRAACELIGLDPLYLANEGKCIVICQNEYAEKILATMRAHPNGKDAALIGYVGEKTMARVILKTSIGGSRLVEPLTGHPLPRIC